MPDIDVARHNRTVDRRTNHGVVQIRLRHRHGGVLLTHLCFRLRHIGGGRVHPGVRRVIVGLGQVQLLFAQNAALEQADRAVIVGLRLDQSSLGFFEVGLGVFQIRRGLQETPE